MTSLRHELRLPWTRPPLSLNDRQHWAAKARTVAEVRRTVAWLARSAQIGAHERVSVGLVYTPAVRRTRDSDNLVATMKPAVDALVDAGIVPDDDEVHVARRWPEIRPVDRAAAGLVLLVEPICSVAAAGCGTEQHPPGGQHGPRTRTEPVTTWRRCSR